MLEVYIDGSTTGNPGPSGIGIFIKGEGHHLKFSEFIGNTRIIQQNLSRYSEA